MIELVWPLFYLVMIMIVVQMLTYFRTELKMATHQQKLDSLTTHLSAIAGQNRKVYNEIVAKIDALKNQNADLDFSALEAAVADLGVSANALDDIVPDEIEAEDPTTPETPETPADPTPTEPENGSDGGETTPEETPQARTAARSTRRK